MITIVRQGHTDVTVHTGGGEPGTRAAVRALHERCMTAYTAGMAAACNLTLAAEALRLEAQESTPVVLAMRAIVAEVQAGRTAGDRHIDWEFAPGGDGRG